MFCYTSFWHTKYVLGILLYGELDTFHMNSQPMVWEGKCAKIYLWSNTCSDINTNLQDCLFHK